MEGDDRESKSNSDKRKEVIATLDKISPSPEYRAARVMELLHERIPELTEWDLVCFAGNYLGYISNLLPWLLQPSKHICNLIYTAHYMDENTNVDTGITHVGAKAESARYDSKDGEISGSDKLP